MNDTRPDPDQLLEQLRKDEDRARRGKLRIYFGANAGVGKTYAMLSAAQRELKAGRDVVVGLVETHGRGDTAQLLEGLPQLPRREIAYRDRVMPEFDIDAALARKPEILLVDELAHSNVPGSRHPKRWHDVHELLDAGIDVWSTLNVQHLESLNGTVGAITGIRVNETVPDKVLDDADELVLVDVTPDELLQRLKAGKVYLPQQAERASQNFFRKGNLIALREMARQEERISPLRRKVCAHHWAFRAPTFLYEFNTVSGGMRRHSHRRLPIATTCLVAPSLHEFACPPQCFRTCPLRSKARFGRLGLKGRRRSMDLEPGMRSCTGTGVPISFSRQAWQHFLRIGGNVSSPPLATNTKQQLKS
jgi:hypothetical protein